MKRHCAGLALILAISASAAAAPKIKLARTKGKIIKAQVKSAPSADGPVFREGRLTISDTPDHAREFTATPKTTVTLDGTPARFQRSATVGTLVLQALYNPKTMELIALELQSAPPVDAEESTFAHAVKGEIANTDILMNMISVRSGRQLIHDYSVPEGISIRRKTGDKRAEPVGLDALQIGDAVEVRSKDGKTADSILARAAN